MKFIGRKMELEKLNAEYERDGGFVVIYGRRRVGKTTLIKEFLKKKAAIPDRFPTRQTSFDIMLCSALHWS